MSDSSGEMPEIPERRDFIEKVTGVVACAGVAAAAWPFINSMNPSQDVLAKANTEIDLSGIEPGAGKTVEWQGKPVFVLHRTPSQIAAMQASNGGKDPQPDSERVARPEWLVVVGLCTHLGCVPTRDTEGWFCPCHGSKFDNSGRILSGPAPSNLARPPYEFLADNKLLLGTRT